MVSWHSPVIKPRECLFRANAQVNRILSVPVSSRREAGLPFTWPCAAKYPQFGLSDVLKFLFHSAGKPYRKGKIQSLITMW